MEESVIKKWLSENITIRDDNNYRYKELKEVEKSMREKAINRISEELRSAHESAKNRYANAFRRSLKPFGDKENTPQKVLSEYPEGLPLQTKKGYFGEVWAGIVVQEMSPFDLEGWRVPVYLLEFHGEAFQYLNRKIKGDIEQDKNVPGRTGDDCLAFRFDDEGKVEGVIFCEAKVRKGHDSRGLKDAHNKVSEAIADIRRTLELLKEKDGGSYNEMAESIEKEYLEGDIVEKRFDFISYSCGKFPSNTKVWSNKEVYFSEYSRGGPLEVTELHFKNINKLVSEVYKKV